jgi:hypothetical protein
LRVRQQFGAAAVLWPFTAQATQPQAKEAQALAKVRRWLASLRWVVVPFRVWQTSAATSTAGCCSLLALVGHQALWLALLSLWAGPVVVVLPFQVLVQGAACLLAVAPVTPTQAQTQMGAVAVWVGAVEAQVSERALAARAARR